MLLLSSCSPAATGSAGLAATRSRAAAESSLATCTTTLLTSMRGCAAGSAATASLCADAADAAVPQTSHASSHVRPRLHQRAVGVADLIVGILSPMNGGRRKLAATSFSPNRNRYRSVCAVPGLCL